MTSSGPSRRRSASRSVASKGAYSSRGSQKSYRQNSPNAVNQNIGSQPKQSSARQRASIDPQFSRGTGGQRSGPSAQKSSPRQNPRVTTTGQQSHSNSSAEPRIPAWRSAVGKGIVAVEHGLGKRSIQAFLVIILLFLSIWIVISVVQDSGSESDSGDTILGEGPIPSASPTSVSQTSNDPRPAEQVGLLPQGAPLTEESSGNFRVAGAPGLKVGEGNEKVFRYAIEIEDTIDAASYGGDDGFAKMIDYALNDPNGWTKEKKFGFEHVDLESGEQPDFVVRLGTQSYTQSQCGYSIKRDTSCYLGNTDQVILNEARWVRGSDEFNGDLGTYRYYMINHEIGHALGYSQHQPCPIDGGLAPIMMQQTLSLNNSELLEISPNEGYEDNNYTCRANAWPYPSSN